MILGIETSGRVGGVALVAPDTEWAISMPLGREGGAYLPEAVELLLQLAQTERSAIELVAVDIGPGSFTGLRVGVAFAKGIAQALGIPVVGVRQTEAVVRPVAWWPGKVSVWIHDRREFVYAAWAVGNRVGEEKAMPWREALDKARSVPGALLVGSGVQAFREEIAKDAPGLTCATASLSYPQPREVASLGWDRFRSAGADDPKTLEPHYVQQEV